MKNMWRYATFRKFSKDTPPTPGLVAAFMKTYPELVTWARAVTDEMESSK